MQLTNTERLTSLRAVETDACIEWTGGLTGKGYGRFTLDGVQTRAHRVSYLWTHGTMPDVVRHTCDNPPCINPRHLVAGTQDDNMKDMAERCRSKRYADLTPEQVQQVRDAIGTQVEIGKRFGIKQSRVSRIRSGRK